jgi:cytochrome c oxidase assembly factor CtaG
VISLFATAAHTSLLGVLLTFSSSAWYRAYAGGAASLELSALEDQQLGGLIMWVPGGVVFVAAALALVATWLTSEPPPPAEPAATRRPG